MCSTLSLTIKGEQRLKVLLRITFEPKRDKTTGVWRKVPNEEVS
jgi:hypothetical protein